MSLLRLSAVTGLGLMLCVTLVQAAGPAIPASHPLLGTWTWSMFSGSCTETYRYSSQRSLLSTSGEEVMEKVFDVAVQPDAQGFYRVSETTVRLNGKKDCSGAVQEDTGAPSVRFIQFSPNRTQLLICQTPALTACFGPLTKVE